MSDHYDRYNGMENLHGTNLAEVGTDCISRQAAIDICASAIDLWSGQLGEGALVAVRDKIAELPSEQVEMHACDSISRQAAIDALEDAEDVFFFAKGIAQAELAEYPLLEGG